MSDSSEATHGEQYSEPDWMQLTEDEDLLWVGHQSLWAYVSGFLTAVLIVALGVGLPILSPALPSFVPIGTLVLGGVTALAGIALAGVTYLQYRFHIYAVTSEQVYQRRGIVSQNIDQVRMEQIQNTSCSQSVIERLLSFGTVQLDTAGTANIELNLWDIKQPQSVNQIVTKRLNEMSTGSGSMSNTRQTA